MTMPFGWSCPDEHLALHRVRQRRAERVEPPAAAPRVGLVGNGGEKRRIWKLLADAT